jgi:hypothetical protein
VKAQLPTTTASFSAVNADYYSNYNRANFIKPLEDWGYYGNKTAKPE